MSAKQTIYAAAVANGWTVHSEPGPDHTGVTEFRRRNGRSIAYVQVDFGVLDQVIYASWAPSLNGFGGGSIASRERDKAARVVLRLQKGA